MTNSYFLFLDDCRHVPQVTWLDMPSGIWIVARSYRAFMETVNTLDVPSLVSFDHDLGSAKSGADCARWLATYCLDYKIKVPEYQVHSMNPVGAENIRSIMESAKRIERLS